MRIAVVGTGIAGMTAAWLLQRRHEVTVFEREARLGGHTHTVDVELGGRHYGIDTGFIVYNERTYPLFTKLLHRVGAATRPAEMSFGVSCDVSGMEYSSNALFAQRRNLLRPDFHWMLLEVVRFNALAQRMLRDLDQSVLLGEFLRIHRFSTKFTQLYLLPMLASIWSAPPRQVLEFPAAHFFRFMDNHGLIHLRNRPQWRVISGGSSRYAELLTGPYREHIRLNAPVDAVWRIPGGVAVKVAGAAPEVFDHVVMATHSDDTLRLLWNATPAELAVLSAIPYQQNDVVLHTDTRLLPHSRRAWASWNYHRTREAPDSVRMTYNMNILQGLEAPETFCVTLNETGDIDPAKVLGRYTYSHPLFGPDSVRAQRRHAEISGQGGVHFCGAHWGYGFHEDGVRSAAVVCQQLGVSFDEELPVSRVGSASALAAG